MSFNKKLGLILRDCRESKHLTREKLAEICDISDRCISNIERGVSNPKADTFMKLYKALEIQPEVLEVICEDIELNIFP